MGSNVVCNPLAEVTKPQITSVATNKTVVEKVSKAVFEQLEQAGAEGKRLEDECMTLGGVERCVKFAFKALNSGFEVG